MKTKIILKNISSVKVDRFSITIFCINKLILTKTIQVYSLAILMKYFLKENSQCSGWFSNNIYMMNNNFCLVTLY